MNPVHLVTITLNGAIVFQFVTLGHFWAVCVKSNGKNRMGGYVGIETNAYVFRGGSIVEKSTHPETYCGSAVYAPFPELEEIG